MADKDGDTPMDLAHKGNQRSGDYGPMIDYLQEKGAKTSKNILDKIEEEV